MEQTYDDISSFLKKKPSHIFSEIISGVIDSSFSGHPVLIIDTKNNLKLWTEAVKACFPEKVISSRKFEELALDKKGNRLLVIHPPLMEEELYTNVFARTFDFKRNEFPGQGRSFKYARLAEYGLLSSGELLDSMRELLSSFSYSCIGEDIDSFCELFLIISDQEKKPDYEGVTKALRFVNKYSCPKAIKEIYKPFRPYMEGLMEGSDKEQLMEVASFGAKALESLGEAISLESAACVLCECLDRLLSEETGCTASEAFQLLTGLLPSKRAAFDSFLINGKRPEAMCNLMRMDPNIERAAFYMRITGEALQSQALSWEQAESNTHINSLISSCSNALAQKAYDINFVTEPLKGDVEVGIILSLLKCISSREALDKLTGSFVNNMDKLPPEGQEAARQELCEMGGARLVYEEYLVRLEASENKQKLFEQWCSGVLLGTPELSQEYYSPVLMAYMKMFKSPWKLFEQCERLLPELAEHDQYLDLVACQMLINSIENGLPLDKTLSGKRELIEYVRRLKKEYGIKTVPDMLFFADFGIWLETAGGGGYSLNTILEGMPSIMFLHGDRLRHFQDWCIPMLMPLVKTPEDHRSLVYSFRAGDHVHEFYQKYMKFVQDYLEEDKLNGYNVFLQFVIYFFYYLRGEYKLSDGKCSIQSAGEMLRYAIYGQPAIFRKRLDLDVRRELKARRLKVPVMWGEIIRQSSAVPKKGFMDRLKGVLAKKRRKK